uniref:EF-hand domain-containing protein n=1 Tax=Picea sitchensis TaxID=3332 RepID=A9NP03_PICSI|nr:unknown [Picea sitchensis]
MGKNLLSRSSRKKSKGGGEDNSSSSSSSRSEPSEPSSVSESLAGALHNREELEDVFKRFDANGDGKISSSELGDILRSMGCRVGPRELGLMMKEADADGDGFISLEEFIDLNTKGHGRRQLPGGLPEHDHRRQQERRRAH